MRSEDDILELRIGKVGYIHLPLTLESIEIARTVLGIAKREIEKRGEE